MTVVYGLIKASEKHIGEPAIRYIGATNVSLAVRLKAHVDLAARRKNLKKDRWVSETLAQGDSVVAIVLCEEEPTRALEIERELIARLKEPNKLFNVRKGGEPFLRKDVKLSDEQREMYSEGQRRRFKHDSERKKVSKRFAGVQKSEEHRLKIAEAIRAYQLRRPKLVCPTCGLSTYAGGMAIHRRKLGH